MRPSPESSKASYPQLPASSEVRNGGVVVIVAVRGGERARWCCPQWLDRVAAVYRLVGGWHSRGAESRQRLRNSALPASGCCETGRREMMEGVGWSSSQYASVGRVFQVDSKGGRGLCPLSSHAVVVWRYGGTVRHAKPLLQRSPSRPPSNACSKRQISSHEQPRGQHAWRLRL